MTLAQGYVRISSFPQRASQTAHSSGRIVALLLVALTSIALGPAACQALQPAAEAQPKAGPKADAAARPNVVFLAIDDLNDWTGFLAGHPQARTPNLDRLAARGVSFTRAYCAAPACNPSRAALLSGVRPSTSGVYHNNQPWRPALPDVVTLPQHFMAHGYHVIGGGKIYHGSYPDPQSWHDYFKEGKDPVPPRRPVNGIPNTAQFDWGPLDAEDDAMADARTVGWAIDYLQADRDRPFFLAVGLHKPHLPWFVPRRHFDLFPLGDVRLPVVREDDLDDVPLLGRRMAKPEGDHRRVQETGNWQRAVQGYLATIAFVDAQVGRLLDALERSDAAEQTILVCWSDHGWHLGQKQHWRKFALWEEATRVPLVVVAPGVTSPRGECGRTVSLMDLYPTLVELCGLAQKPGVEGTSLAPLLKDPETAWNHPALMTHGRGNHAVRSERWRYIRYSDGTEELYDHEADPREWTNLASLPEHTGVKRELARWLPKVDADDAATRREAREP